MLIPYVLEPSTLFRGKRLLPVWLEAYQCETLALLREHGQDKVLKVYDWVFKYMAAMQWGQWLVVEKIAPNASARRLLYWCLELIYQSDLVSDFRIVSAENETRVVSWKPDPERLKKIAIFTGEKGYILNDWYNRILANPKCNSDINPAWLGIEQDSEQESTVPEASPLGIDPDE